MMYYPNIELISPDSTGIIRTKLNKEQLKPIWDNVKEIEKDFDAHSNQSANDGLVGHIQREFWLKEETSRYLDSFILPLIQKHTETYDYVHKQPTFRKEFGGMALDTVGWEVRCLVVWIIGCGIIVRMAGKTIGWCIVEISVLMAGVTVLYIVSQR